MWRVLEKEPTSNNEAKRSEGAWQTSVERWLFPFLSSATKENVVVACVSQSMMVATTLDLKTGVVTVNGTVVWLSGMRTRASSMTSGDQHGFEYSQSRVRKTATVALVAVSRVCGGASTESVNAAQANEEGKKRADGDVVEREREGAVVAVREGGEGRAAHPRFQRQCSVERCQGSVCEGFKREKGKTNLSILVAEARAATHRTAHRTLPHVFATSLHIVLAAPSVTHTHTHTQRTQLL